MKWERILSEEKGATVRYWKKGEQILAIMSDRDDGTVVATYFATEKTWPPEYIKTRSIQELNNWIKEKTKGELELSASDIDAIAARMMEFWQDVIMAALKRT